ncbi:MAG: hypothetical protein DI570_16465 [Phenylobacterium zucineum]|nr:MAG: hypothetical protein DI570_16465 [Phenylobacterium zucineum]
MKLHPNAAMRTLHRELQRLNDGRPELMLALDDPRLPAGVAADQLAQLDAEIQEIGDMCRLLARHLEARAARRLRSAA